MFNKEHFPEKKMLQQLFCKEAKNGVKEMQRSLFHWFKQFAKFFWQAPI